MKNSNSLTVAVIGATDKADRYSFKAIQMLLEHGHTVYPITPRRISLPNMMVFPTVTDVPQPLHTVSLYVNPSRLEAVADEIIEANPTRVIFNPGTEHPEIQQKFREAGIETVEACTLVMLGMNQFND